MTGAPPHDRRAIAACGRGALLVWMLLVPAIAAAAPPRFDPQRNPFAYAGEYRDPSWGGTYLRARWYQPQLPTFVSRDPLVAQLSHYGYGGGNPVMRVDPSGMSYRSGTGWLRDSSSFVNRGVGGDFARLFLGNILVPLQIVANPRQFWRSMAHDTGGTAIFLAGGVALEGLAYGGTYARAGRALFAGKSTALFWGRVAGETTLGVGQSAFGSFSGHFRHFHGGSLVAGLESIVGPEMVYRLGAGIGYQPFNLDYFDVTRLWARTRLAFSDDLHVFRVREDRYSAGALSMRATWTTPWQERAGLGLYHDKLIALSFGEMMESEFFVGVRRDSADWGEFENRYRFFAPDRTGFRFDYVGRFDGARGRTALASNPANLVTAEEIAAFRTTGTKASGRNPYNVYSHNCHTHVGLIIRDLQGGG